MNEGKKGYHFISLSTERSYLCVDNNGYISQFKYIYHLNIINCILLDFLNTLQIFHIILFNFY